MLIINDFFHMYLFICLLMIYLRVPPNSVNFINLIVMMLVIVDSCILAEWWHLSWGPGHIKRLDIRCHHALAICRRHASLTLRVWSLQQCSCGSLIATVLLSLHRVVLAALLLLMALWGHLTELFQVLLVLFKLWGWWRTTTNFHHHLLRALKHVSVDIGRHATFISSIVYAIAWTVWPSTMDTASCRYFLAFLQILILLIFSLWSQIR